MLRQAQHEGFARVLILSLSKDEQRRSVIEGECLDQLAVEDAQDLRQFMAAFQHMA
jgi:hypothetical protein